MFRPESKMKRHSLIASLSLLAGAGELSACAGEDSHHFDEVVWSDAGDSVAGIRGVFPGAPTTSGQSAFRDETQIVRASDPDSGEFEVLLSVPPEVGLSQVRFMESAGYYSFRRWTEERASAEILDLDGSTRELPLEDQSCLVHYVMPSPDAAAVAVASACDDGDRVDVFVAETGAALAGWGGLDASIIPEFDHRLRWDAAGDLYLAASGSQWFRFAGGLGTPELGVAPTCPDGPPTTSSKVHADGRVLCLDGGSIELCGTGGEAQPPFGCP